MSVASARSRVPSGVRQGGQFATEGRAEADVTLDGYRPGSPPSKRWMVSYWDGDLALMADDEVKTSAFATRAQADAEADRLAAAGYHVHVENWSARHPQDAVSQGWALVGARDPAPDPQVVQVTPTTMAELRRALNNRVGEPDGKRRVVVIAAPSGWVRHQGDLTVRGPNDGRTLTVRLSGAFTPLRVESGNVVVLADSTLGNAVHTGFGAHVQVQAYPDRKVSTTTDPGGHTVLRVAAGCHGYQHCEAGGVLEVVGDQSSCSVRTGGDGRGKRATVCAVCRQSVSIHDNGSMVHAGGMCPGPPAAER